MIMLRISCLLIIVQISLCQSTEVDIADEFSIETFSELLNDWEHAHLGRRFKRHPPHPHHEMECCGDTPNTENMEMIKECFQNMKELGPPKSREDGMKRGLCLAECIGKLRKVVTGDGIVDKATFVEEIKKYDSDTWRQEQAEANYDKCIESAKTFKEKIDEKAPDSECDAQVAGFFHCQMREIVLNCPDDKFKSDDMHCKIQREWAQKNMDDMM